MDTNPPTRAPLLQVLSGIRVDPVPIWLMRQAGRYLPEYRELRAKAGGFLDLCFDPDLAAEVTLQPIRRFGLDAAILFADILLIPMALGVDLRFETGEGPRLTPVSGKRDVDRLLPAEAIDQVLAPVYRTVGTVRASLPAERTLIGFAGAPWTVATYMVEGGTSRDFASTRRWAMAEPESFGVMIDLITAATIRYLSAQITAGADAVQLFDSWAGALPAEQMARWSFAPMQRIIAALKNAHPDVPVIIFPRLVGPALADAVTTTGCDGVGLDSHVTMDWAARSLPEGVAIQGNLDPMWLETGGAAMCRQADIILSQAAGRPHIFNLGHGVIKSTPPEHVAELVAYVRAHTPSEEIS